MAAVHVQAVVASDGTLTVHGLPSLAGHIVDVLVRDASRREAQTEKYPLHGKPLRYERAFDSVAEADWDAAR